MMDKKANMVAAIIVGVVIIATTLLLLNSVKHKEEAVDKQQRIVNEADSTMKQAISLGVRDWLKNGFSNKNKVWYSTYSLPPDPEEALDSLNEMVNSQVDAYMNRLEEENGEYDIKDDVEVVFELDQASLDDPDNIPEDALEGLSASVKDFHVGLQNDDGSQIQDISTEYEYAYRAWLIYKTIYDWMEGNADDMTQHLFNDALMAKPCQLMTGGCDCGEISFSETAIQELYLTWGDVEPVIQARIDTLNDMFADTGIKCEFSPEKTAIDNIRNIKWTIGDVGPDGTTRVSQEDIQSRYTFTPLNWDESSTLPAAGDYNGGLPSAGNGETYYVNDEGGVERPNLNIDNGIVDTYNKNPVRETCDGYVTRMGGDANLAQTMKIGMLAVDKKLAILLKVKCSDPTQKMEGVSDFDDLSAEFGMRIAIALDCPLPTNSKDIYMDSSLYDEDPVSCPGGSCFPAGTMITMADGTKKPIEKVNLGDKVLSYNTYSKKFRSGVVLELESPVREGIYSIDLSDGSGVRVTNEHPFYVKKPDGRIGWASIMPEETYKETKTIDNVMTLEIGDSILKDDESWAEVTEIYYTEGPIQTYNLKEVSTYDNFFADDLLAHNKCCFAAGTPITMADGTTKPVEDVVVGDFVLTYNEMTGKTEPSEVLELQKPVREGIYIMTFENGKVLKVTNDHPLYTRKSDGRIGWGAIEPDAALAGYALDSVMRIVAGDEIMQQDGSFARVSGIEYKKGDIQTYTLKKVAKNKNFFANGFLAHNQKLIGYVGLMCPIECPPCYGCAPAEGVTEPRQGVDSDWQCVGPIPNLICGPCSLCDASGGCTIPQVDGYPCFDDNGDNMMAGNNGNGGSNYADCWACQGGECQMNPPSITNIITIPCTGNTPCASCSGNGLSPSSGGCAAPLAEDSVCNDMSIPENQRNCQICPAGAPGACVADSAMDGELCDDCATCSSGVCNAPAPGTTGNCASTERPCMQCSDTQAGACIIDLDRDSECPQCQMCAGDGTCTVDPSKIGESCGTCRVCNAAGECVPGNEGQQCKSANGCTWTCQSGSCRVSNIGASCTLSGNTCGLNQKCTDSGCETTSSDQNMVCCGTARCAAGSACCVPENMCEACPSPR